MKIKLFHYIQVPKGEQELLKCCINFYPRGDKNYPCRIEIKVPRGDIKYVKMIFKRRKGPSRIDLKKEIKFHVIKKLHFCFYLWENIFTKGLNFSNNINIIYILWTIMVSNICAHVIFAPVFRTGAPKAIIFKLSLSGSIEKYKNLF